MFCLCYKELRLIVIQAKVTHITMTLQKTAQPELGDWGLSGEPSSGPPAIPDCSRDLPESVWATGDPGAPDPARG